MHLPPARLCDKALVGVVACNKQSAAALMLIYTVHHNTGAVSFDFYREFSRLLPAPSLEHVNTEAVQPEITPRVTLGASTHRSRICHTKETDFQIMQLVNKFGCHWREIARAMGGRANGFSDDTVRNRYIRMAGVVQTPVHKAEHKEKGACHAWTADEDEELRIAILVHTENGRVDWRSVVQYGCLKSRGRNASRNRAHRLNFVSSKF